MSDNTTSSAVKSAVRVLRVFELFDALRQPLTVSDIARELEMPVSSSLMLIRSMTELGYLAFEESRKTYFPTPRLSGLTQWIESSAAGIGNISQLMRDLHELTNETVVLAVEQGTEVRFLRIIRSAQPLALSVDEGGTAPIDSSTIGLAMLAAKGPDDFERLLRRLAARHGDDFSEERQAALRQRIEEIRKERVAIGYGLMSEGIGAIAVALPKGKAGLTFTVSVGGPRERIAEREAHIVDCIREAINIWESEPCAA